jgi:hypothetical protein
MKNPLNPFPGPQPLRASIYGRDDETSELLDRLRADRFVLLYGPSGAGKSSLIHAGILPRLKNRIMATMRVNRTGAQGFNRYAASCLESLLFPVDEPRDMIKFFGKEPEWDELLFFDQFEEILTTDPLDHKGREEFFRQLGDLLRVRGRWAVFTVREDCLAPLEQYLDWLPTCLASRMRLNVLDDEHARVAIVSAVQEGGLQIEDDAVDALLKILSVAGSVEPVQLQVVCHRLWNSLDEKTVTIGASAVPAGDASLANAALTEFYETVVAKVAAETKVAERALRDWFDDELISDRNTRLQTENLSTISREAAGLFESGQLIRSELRRVTCWWELAHDHLIRPITESNRAWKAKNLSLLQRNAEVWKKTEFSEDNLLRGANLREAKKWRSRNGASELEEKYLKASIEAQNTRILRRCAMAAPVVVLVLVMLTVVMVQRAANRDRNVEFLSASAIHMVSEEPDTAVYLALAAEEQWHDSPIHEFFRNHSFFTPGSRHRYAETAARGALLAATAEYDPRYLRTEWESREKAPAGSEVLQKLDPVPSPGEKRIAHADLSDNSITVVDSRSGSKLPLLAGPHDLHCLAWSPDSSILAAGGEDGSVYLWYFKAAKPMAAPPLQAHSLPVLNLIFSSDGKQLTSYGADYRKVTWRLGPEFDPSTRQDWPMLLIDAPAGNGDTMKQLRAVTNGADALATTEDGEFAAHGNQTAIEVIREGQSWGWIHLDEDPGNLAECMAFAPGGSVLATADRNKKLQFWDINSMRVDRVRERGRPVYTDATLKVLVYSANGEWLAALDGKNSVQFYDPASHMVVGGKLVLPWTPVGIGFGEKGKTLRVLSPNGNRVVDFPIDPGGFHRRGCSLLPVGFRPSSTLANLGGENFKPCP